MPESRSLHPVLGLAFFFAALAGAQQYRFSQPVTLPSNGVLPFQVETADFNGDGYADFAVLNATQNTADFISGNATNSTISVYLSNGDGTFGNPTVFVLPCLSLSFRARPLVTKGPISLLAVCAVSNQIVVYPGNGDGTFGPSVGTEAPSNILGFTDVMRFALEDFNGDGKLDMAYIALSSGLTLSSSNDNVNLVAPVQILFGNGDGTFGNNITVPGVSGISISPGDFNGDGNFDLVVSTPQNFNLGALSDSSQFPQGPSNIEILLGDGHGNFTLANTYSVSFSALTQTVGDVNGDGILDIAVTGFEGGPVVFLGKGDGSFTQASANQVFAVGHAAIADLRSIGKPDLILPVEATSFGSNTTPQLPSLLPGNGDGTFGALQQLPVNQFATSVAVGDFDGNGTPDLVFAVFPVNLADLSGDSDKTPGPGTAEVLINLDPRTVNAASFATGSVASDSIAAMFGVGLAATAVPNNGTLGTTLGGVTLNVQDSSGVSRPAPLFYVSPKQINFEVPAGTAAGPATLTVNSGGAAITMTKQIVTLAPGIFELNSNGLVAAVVLRLKGGSTSNEDIEKIYQLSSGKVVPLPLDLGLANSDQVYLEIFGTGIRNATRVTATVAGTTVPVHFHGPSGDVGEDQVNIGPLPASLAGAGAVTLVLTADGIASNSVFLVMK